MGLGDLQKAVGPDSRVTLSTEMFDTSPADAVIDGVATRHYTGVYHAYARTGLLESADQDDPNRGN